MIFTPSARKLQSSDGTAIYAEAIGNPGKPAIVMTHGMCLSSATLDVIFNDPRLYERYYLVRYDMRGHGRSGMPTDIESYKSSLWADDFAAVLQAFGLTKVIFFGWSYAATVVVDICTNIDPLPLAGLFFIAPLPYVGPIMTIIGTPTVNGFLPGLMNETDVDLNRRTKIAFVDSTFVDPANVDFRTKTAWIGQASLQPAGVLRCLISRAQDPQKMFDAGRAGLPMMVLGGTADTQVMSEAVAREMKPYFKKLELQMVEGGGHALHHDHPDVCVEALLKFADRVMVSVDHSGIVVGKLSSYKTQ